MEVTEIRISRRTQGDGKLKGYAAVTFDDVFVVRDLKIIEGKKGLFVAMPSQKIQVPCIKCKKKNAVRSKYCNECGTSLPMKDRTRREVHRDIAHPVNSDMRSYLQKVIIEAFEANQDSTDNANDNASEHSNPDTTKEETTPVNDTNTEANTETVQAPVSDDYLSTPSLNAEDRVSEEHDSTRELLDTIE